MKEIGKIVGYVFFVLLGACLLAPPMYWGGRWLVETDLIPQLAKVPFSRYFNRAVLVMALGSLVPFLRWLGVRGWRDLGLVPNPHRVADLKLGLLVSILGVALIAVCVVALGAAEVHEPFRWGKVGLAFLTGLAVAIIEEVFFRGALLGVLRRRLPDHVALGFLSVVFAILHFVKPHRAARKMADISWTSGFEILPYSFHQFSDPQLVAYGWVTLLIFGWILGWAAMKTRSLYLAMALHGGWVFGMRSFAGATKRVGEPNALLGANLTIGLVPVGLLLLSLGILWAVLKRRETRTG